jgi:hypothetical protein
MAIGPRLGGHFLNFTLVQPAADCIKKDFHNPGLLKTSILGGIITACKGFGRIVRFKTNFLIL